MKTILILTPLFWTIVPLPFAGEGDQHLARALFFVTTLAVILVYASTRRSLPQEWLRSHGAIVQSSLFAVPFLLLLLLTAAANQHFGVISFLMFFFLAAMWGGYHAVQDSLSAPAIVSLGLTVAALLSFEWMLHTAPASMLRPEIRSTPHLYSERLDRAETIYRNEGFRGRRASSPTPETIRIFSMGGSSTFGVPIVNPLAPYPARLAKLLQERRPRENYQVFNAGLAGMGIMQILAALKSTIIPLGPDIVTISAWYNDSSKESIWYGTPGRSDRDVYYLLRLLKWVENLPVFHTMYRTRTFAYFRYLLIRARDAIWMKRTSAGPAPKVRRMSPEEFSWALREIALLGREHHFLPVFAFEVLNRSGAPDIELGKNEYYRVVKSVAEEFDIPLADTLADFAAHREEWLFYDAVHLNENGHRLMAESIFKTLFDSSSLGADHRQFLAARGVRWDLPNVFSQFTWIGEKEALLRKGFQFEASGPFLESGSVPISVSVGDRRVALFPGLTGAKKLFQVPAELLGDSAPLSRIVIRAAPEELPGAPKERYMLSVSSFKLGSAQ